MNRVEKRGKEKEERERKRSDERRTGQWEGEEMSKWDMLKSSYGKMRERALIW